MHQPEFWAFSAEKYRKDPPQNSERICFKNVRKREKNGGKQRKTEILRSPFLVRVFITDLQKGGRTYSFRAGFACDTSEKRDLKGNGL